MASNASNSDAQTGRNGQFQEQVSGALSEDVLNGKKVQDDVHMENIDSNIDSIDIDHCIDETPTKETKQERSASLQHAANHAKGCSSNADVHVATSARAKTNVGPPPNMIPSNTERGFTTQSDFIAGRAQREDPDGGGYSSSEGEQRECVTTWRSAPNVLVDIYCSVAHRTAME